MWVEEKWAWEPSGSTTRVNVGRTEMNWSEFDSSVNAVSFGFVATAVLISMFLLMAIFERFLSSNNINNNNSNSNPISFDVESQLRFHPKLGFPSPKMTVYSQGLSVLMPGEATPTFIAQPVPLPCPPNRIQWPPPLIM